MAEVDRTVLDAQRNHWQDTFAAHPTMYGRAPSQAAAHAVALFTGSGVREVLELGAGQGRDTLCFLAAGLDVTALDYSAEGLAEVTETAGAAGLAPRLKTAAHDVRQPLPLPDASVDAVYSHMLFNMALTTAEIEQLAAEVRRVLRPGGWHVYTARHTGDAHYGTGIDRGDNMTEHGGFVVHFFDRALVDRVAVGFSAPEIVAFEEGALPRRLWRVTQRRSSTDAVGEAADRSRVDALLADARTGLDRVQPADLAAELAAGALVVDTRPVEQRQRDGDLPGAVVIDRNVLEWRLDPTSPHRLPEASDPDRRVIVVCNEGFSSSLAAATLRRLGLRRATDLVGGFQAWAGLATGDRRSDGGAGHTVG